MTDRTITRLRAYGRGNGIKSEDIILIESKEEIFTVLGNLTLTPHCDVTSRTALGRMKGKAYKVLASFAELRTEVDAIKKEFEDGGAWTEDAIKELENTTGHGWGLHGSLLCWSDKTTILGATENCPTCRGTAQHPCNECHGLGSVPCHNCQSRGQEICPLCAGHGHDPNNPNNKCPTCNGTGWALCRFCQGQMKLPCVHCHGRGNTPCTDCHGSGFISQEVQITKGARMDFAIATTASLPSGLLRSLTRVGEDKLCKGHADITMKPDIDPNAEGPKSGPLLVRLEAKIPYTDIKLKIDGKSSIVSCFGKLGKLSGIPPFLDSSLQEARKHLADAVAGREPIEMALGARAMNEAFGLVLAGKTHPNELRRLYPVGLSGQAAQEIMKNLTQYFRKATARTRLIVSTVCVLVSAMAFCGLFFTSAFNTLAAMGGKLLVAAIKGGFLATALGATWLALQLGARSALSKQLKGTKVAAQQSLGRTGATALGIMTLLYLIILFLSGNLI